MYSIEQSEQGFWDNAFFQAFQQGMKADQAVVEANAALAARRSAFPPAQQQPPSAGLALNLHAL